MYFLLFFMFVCCLTNIRGDDLLCYYNCDNCANTEVLEYKFCGAPKTTPMPSTTTATTAASTSTSSTLRTEYACYRADKKENSASDKHKRHYGCVQFPKDADNNDCKKLAVSIENEQEEDLKNCFICKEPGCNHSTIIELSTLALINVIIFRIII